MTKTISTWTKKIEQLLRRATVHRGHRVKRASDAGASPGPAGAQSPKWVRLAAYGWAGPNTCLGIALGGALGGRFRLVDGVVEIEGPHVAWVLKRLWIPAAALTLGHCVLGRSPDALAATRRHERVHVRQYERWGPFFIPAYLAAFLWLSLRGRSGYWENPFERQAYGECDADGRQPRQAEPGGVRGSRPPE